MKYLKYITLVALLAFAVSCSKDDDGENMPPEPTPPVEKPEPQAVTLPQKELRGAWITTVWGIDWPMEDYNAATQQKKYTDYLDLLVANNMNAVFFQIRGMADAFYESQYESWSKNITGTAGKNPGYDVLGFLVEEAHKRGLQFHAWMNPYRISTRASKNSSFAELDTKIPVAWTKDYNKIRIYNPLTHIRQKDDHIRCLNGDLSLLTHALQDQIIGRWFNTTCINHCKLCIQPVYICINSVSCYSRRILDNRNLLSCQGIE